MKPTKALITLLAAAALAVGCHKEETSAQALDKVNADTKELAQSTREYTYAQKNEYVESMQSQLAALNQDVDKLSAKVENASDAVNADAKPKIQALRDQAAKLSKQLDEVKGSSESTWSEVKAGTQKAWDGFKGDVTQARQWVSDKIAP